MINIIKSLRYSIKIKKYKNKLEQYGSLSVFKVHLIGTFLYMTTLESVYPCVPFYF